MAILAPNSPCVLKMAEGFLLCRNCGEKQSLTPNLVAEYFRKGWPVCCPETLKGGTMQYYEDETQLEKVGKEQER